MLLFKRIYTVLIVAFLAFVNIFVYISPAQAITFQITPRLGWGADNSLVSGVSKSSQQIQNIKIEDFTTSDDTLDFSTQTYLQGLYYYLANSYQSDLPFNYFVGWDGKIYEGAEGGVGISALNGASGSLTIGYLDDGSGISNLAQQSFSYLLSNLSVKTGLGLDKILPGGYSYINGTFSYSDPSTDWSSQISNLKSVLSKTITAKTTPITYSVGIDDMKISTSSDGNYLVNVSFTNSSSVVLSGRIYAGSDNSSLLYVQGIWVSQQRSEYTDIGSIDTGGKGSLSFEVSSKAQKGNYTLFLYTDVSKINNSGININISGTTPVLTTPTPTPNNVKAIKIVSSVGYLNVRSEPSFSGQVIGKVNNGQTFTLISTSNNISGAWDEIKYDGTNLGWIDAKFTQ